MKILDEKARLFGKINIIDFIVLLFLICLTPMLWFGYKMAAKEPEVVLVEKVIIKKAEYDQMKARIGKLDGFLAENKRYRKHLK